MRIIEGEEKGEKRKDKKVRRVRRIENNIKGDRKERK